MPTPNSRRFKFNYLKSLHGIEFPSDKYYRVLVTLLDYADPDGTNAHPGNERLAADCQCSADHVRKKILPWLRTRGFIILSKQGRHRVGASEWRFPEFAPRSTAGHLDTLLSEGHSRASGNLSAGSQPGLQRPAHQALTKTTGVEPGGCGVVKQDPWATAGSPAAPGSRSDIGEGVMASGPQAGNGRGSAFVSKANEKPDPWGSPPPQPHHSYERRHDLPEGCL